MRLVPSNSKLTLRVHPKIYFPWIEVAKGFPQSHRIDHQLHQTCPTPLPVFVLLPYGHQFSPWLILTSLLDRSVDPSPSISIRGWRLLEGGGELWFTVFLLQRATDRWMTIGPSSGHHPADLWPEHLHHRLRSLHKVRGRCVDVLRLHFFPRYSTYPNMELCQGTQIQGCFIIFNSFVA